MSELHVDLSQLSSTPQPRCKLTVMHKSSSCSAYCAYDICRGVTSRRFGGACPEQQCWGWSANPLWNQARSMHDVGPLARLGWTLRAREHRTCSPNALSLALSLLTISLCLPRQCCHKCSDGARTWFLVPSNRVAAALCEASAWVLLPQLGVGLAQQSLTSMLCVLKSLRKTFMGNAGLQRQCRHIWSGRWGNAEPSASISTNFDLPERRPLPKTVLACPLAVLAAPGLLELSMEHARRTRPWGH